MLPPLCYNLITEFLTLLESSHLRRTCKGLRNAGHGKDVHHHWVLSTAQSFALLRSPNVMEILSRGTSIHTLNLFRMSALVNVSRLRWVHTLDLSLCTSVIDVSSLGHGSLHTLSLHGCYNISDVSALGSLKVLSISNCPNVTDVSALNRLNTLDIGWCANVRDLSPLLCVPTLILPDATYRTPNFTIDPEGVKRRRVK